MSHFHNPNIFGISNSFLIAKLIFDREDGMGKSEDTAETKTEEETKGYLLLELCIAQWWNSPMFCPVSLV